MEAYFCRGFWMQKALWYNRCQQGFKAPGLSAWIEVGKSLWVSVLCNPLRVQKKTSECFSFPGLKQWAPGSCGAERWDAQPKGVLRAYLWQVRGVMAGPLQGFSIVRRMRTPEDRSKTMWTYLNGDHHISTVHQHQLKGCFPTSMLYSCKGTFVSSVPPAFLPLTAEELQEGEEDGSNSLCPQMKIGRELRRGQNLSSLWLKFWKWIGLRFNSNWKWQEIYGTWESCH